MSICLLKEKYAFDIYRIIKGDTILNEDFKSYIEMGKSNTSQQYPFIEYGISVNTNLEELKKAKRSIGALKKFKNIAVGKTYKYTGVVQLTPSNIQPNHHTWWLYKDVYPETFFSIID